MKRILLIAALLLVVVTPVALADNYKLDFVTGLGQIQLSFTGWSGTVWTGPYTFNVTDTTTNSTPTQQKLVCVDGAILGDASSYVLNAGTVNDEAAWIAVQMLMGNHVVSGDTLFEGAQLEIWQLVSPGNNIATTTSGVQSLASSWNTAWINAERPTANYYMYTPNEGTGQRFIGVPEPSLIILLGIGLMAISALAFWRK